MIFNFPIQLQFFSLLFWSFSTRLRDNALVNCQDDNSLLYKVQHKTNVRFGKMNDFESNINAIDFDYDSEDVTFAGYVYKLNTP